MVDNTKPGLPVATNCALTLSTSSCSLIRVAADHSATNMTAPLTSWPGSLWQRESTRPSSPGNRSKKSEPVVRLGLSWPFGTGCVKPPSTTSSLTVTGRLDKLKMLTLLLHSCAEPWKTSSPSSNPKSRFLPARSVTSRSLKHSSSSLPVRDSISVISVYLTPRSDWRKKHEPTQCCCSRRRLR